MIKISKQKFFLTTIAVAVLLVSSTTFLLMPSARAATISNSQDHTNMILSSVLGINPSAYSTQVNSQTNTQDKGLPQNQIDFTLISNQSSVRVSSTFVNNTLNLLYLSEYRGILALAQPASGTAMMAKNFLENYQTCTRNSLYGTLASTLNGVTGSANITKATGSMTLEVLNSNEATIDYVWTYTEANGITAPSKNVELSYYQGQLNCFINNWPLYNIIGVPTVPRQQAITTALAAAQNYTYQVSGNVTSAVSLAGFQIAPESLSDMTLSYVNCPDVSNARNGSPFNLYPSWWVPLGFDKFYPGDVSGIAVTVWADTGQVGSTELMTADSGIAKATQPTASQTVIPGVATDASQSSMMLTAPIVIVAILCVGALFVSKKRISKLAGGKKLFNPMLWGLLLCSVIILSAAISAVKADSVFPNSSARIYGSLDGGNGSPPQTQEEKDAAYWVQGQLDNDFAASDYTTFNNVEGDTTVANVGGNASSDAATYDHCTVFQYGHMIGYGNGYVDNTGNYITASYINQSVTNNKYTFELLWVCCQAETSSGLVGITPICDAWMHNGVSNTDGYNSPDSSGQCFISFYGFSPWIGNDTQTFEEQWTPSMKNFIQDFYYNALVNGYDIRDSLNQASISIFSTTYTSSILCQGYNLWWPGDQSMQYPFNNPGWYPQGFPGHEIDTKNSMQVFGDSLIELYQPYVNLNAVDLDNSNNQLSPEFTINSEQVGTGSYYFNCFNIQTQQEYTVSVPSISGYQFEYFEYSGDQWCRDPANIPLWTGGTLTACYSEVTTCILYVEAIDGYSYNTLTPNVYVDGNWAGTATMLIHVTPGYHTVTVDDPTYNPYYWYDESLVAIIDENYNQYYNGQSILMYSDTSIFVWYGTC